MSGKDMERRVYSTEIRATANGTLRGYAAVFDSDSLDLGGFIERIAKGSFASSLRRAESDPENSQIHAFWNHDSGIPLGSTKSGNLSLREDERGLAFELKAKRLTPQQLDAVRDGEMRMSFGFRTIKDDWAQRSTTPVRTLLDVELFEVSLVSQPAYPETLVSARALQMARSHVPSTLDDWDDWDDDLPPAPVKRTAPTLTVEEARRKLAAAMADPPPRVRSVSAGKTTAELRRMLDDERRQWAEAERQSAARAARQADPCEALRQLGVALRGASESMRRSAEDIAFHEGGHAVMSHLQGSGVRSVRLNLSFGDRGELRLEGGSMKRHGDGSALVSVAGIAVDRERGVRDCLTSTRQDRERAAGFLRAGAAGLEGAIQEAREKLHRHWPAVQAVASALLERVELSGAEAGRIIRSAPVRTGVDAIHPDAIDPLWRRQHQQEMGRRMAGGAAW